MPRKKVPPIEDTAELEVQEGSPGIEAPQPEGAEVPAQEDGTSAPADGSETLDETSRMLAELDGEDPPADPTQGEDSGEGAFAPPPAKEIRRRKAAAQDHRISSRTLCSERKQRRKRPLPAGRCAYH